ncbi:MAG TPA: hypothetical protein VHN36_20565 [Ilumatobacteraceae bacterium]|nr:hypothetical protein [Ilumatobacteraceae bacterium]
MRTRQKLTAVGAVALATSAIGGGAVATSHAMADSTTPAKGTMTVISMTADSGGAFKCVYDDIDLPTLAVGTGTPNLAGGPTVVSGEATSVITGTGPVDANGKPIAGAVMVWTGSATPPDGAPPAGEPTLVMVNATADGTDAEAGTSVGGAGETTQAGQVPSGLPPIAIDSVDARPGTAEECAAMKPTTVLDPPPLAP